MTDSIQTLKKDRDAILLELRTKAASVESEGRGFTDEEKEFVTDRMAKAREKTEAISAAAKSAIVANDVVEFLAKAEAAELNDEALDGAQLGAGTKAKSLGEQFAMSEQFKSFRGQYKGGIPDGVRVQTAPSEVKGGLKALIGTGQPGGSGVGNLYDPQRLPMVEAQWRKTTLRDVVTVGTTTSDSIVFAKQLRVGAGSVNGAAGVPEARSAAPIGDGTGGTTTPLLGGVKPQSTITFTKQTANVITIAHWIPATKKALSDAGQLRTLIDNFLRKGLEAETERQLLAGDSTVGEEWDGLLNTEGVQTQGYTKNILATLRRALTKVSVYGTANAILVSPGTAERIDLLEDNTGRPLGNGAFGNAYASVWRTPLVEVPGLDDNTVLVGDFSTAVIWDREEATITATDSHSDFFIRNLVAILAEARAAFGVLDPALIVKASVQGEDVFGNAQAA
jgi:HK97 family phage major capsid protein